MRIKLSIAAVVAVIIALAGVTLASADNGGSSDFTLYSLTDQEAFIDEEPTGGDAPTLGDQNVFSDVLSKERGGEQIGTTHVVCTVTRVESPEVTSLCAATASLPGGQLTIEGVVTFDVTLPGGGTFDLAVTGGTGDYEGAGGHITVEELSDTEARVTVHLLD
jgi:hypothetical protein